jgi:hypothetical protein
MVRRLISIEERQQAIVARESLAIAMALGLGTAFAICKK